MLLRPARTTTDLIRKPLHKIPLLALTVLVSLCLSSPSLSQTGSQSSIPFETLEKLSDDSAVKALDSIWLSMNAALDSSTIQDAKQVAKLFRAKNAPSKSVQVYEVLGVMAREQGDTLLMSESAYYQGLGYRSLGLNNEALLQLFESLAFSEKVRQSEWERVSLIQVGIIKKDQGLYYEAIESFERALEIAKAEDYGTGIASVLNNIGSTYKLLGDYQLAKEYIQEAIELNKASGNIKYLSYNYNNLANIYEEIEEFEDALTYQNKSIEYKVQLDDQPSLGVSYLNKGIILNKLGQPSDAIELLNQSLDLALKYSLVGIVPITYSELAKSYSALDNSQRAYELMLSASNFKDSLNEADKKTFISEMESFYNQEKILSENSELKRNLETESNELKRRDTLLFSLFAIIAILLILVSAYIIANRKRVSEARTYKEQLEALQERSAKIQDQSQRIEWNTTRLEQLKNDNELYLTTLRSDVRGLVSAINALLGIIQKGNQDSELTQQLVLLAFSSENLMWLIENILDFDSDLSAETGNLQEVQVQEALEGVAKNFKRLFDEKGVPFESVFSLKEPVRQTSAQGLHRIAFSLLDSAFKLTSEGPVRFEVFDEDDLVILALQCSHRNIPAGFLKRVFNRFYLASSENYEILGGSGLNLYMINKIAEENNWSFETTQHPASLEFKLKMPMSVAMPAQSV